MAARQGRAIDGVSVTQANEAKGQSHASEPGIHDCLVQGATTRRLLLSAMATLRGARDRARA